MSTTDARGQFQSVPFAGLTKIWQVKGSDDHSPFFYRGGMKIDLDGAIDAYAPIGSGLIGSDLLGNAIAIKDKSGRSPWLVEPKTAKDRLKPATNPNWTPTYASTVRDPRSGASIRQTFGPYAGYYISETSLKDIWHGQTNGAETDSAYQTDASHYPYIALSKKHLASTGLELGDYVLAIHGITGLYVFGVFADGKKVAVATECSSALASALHVPSDRTGGTEHPSIVYLVFPNSGLGPKQRPELSTVHGSGLRWLRFYDERINLVAEVVRFAGNGLPGVGAAFRALGFTVPA